MFLRSFRIELTVLNSYETPRPEEDEYINESLEKMETAFNIVEKQIRENSEYIVK